MDEVQKVIEHYDGLLDNCKEELVKLRDQVVSMLTQNCDHKNTVVADFKNSHIGLAPVISLSKQKLREQGTPEAITEYNTTPGPLKERDTPPDDNLTPNTQREYAMLAQ